MAISRVLWVCLPLSQALFDNGVKIGLYFVGQWSWIWRPHVTVVLGTDSDVGFAFWSLDVSLGWVFTNHWALQIPVFEWAIYFSSLPLNFLNLKN
jgi:hypothetical protein